MKRFATKNDENEGAAMRVIYYTDERRNSEAFRREIAKQTRQIERKMARRAKALMQGRG